MDYTMKDVFNAWNKEQRELPNKMTKEEVFIHLQNNQAIIMKGIFVANGFAIKLGEK